MSLFSCITEFKKAEMVWIFYFLSVIVFSSSDIVIQLSSTACWNASFLDQRYKKKTRRRWLFSFFFLFPFPHFLLLTFQKPWGGFLHGVLPRHVLPEYSSFLPQSKNYNKNNLFKYLFRLQGNVPKNITFFLSFLLIKQLFWVLNHVLANLIR